MLEAKENPEKTSKNQEDGDKLCIFLRKPLVENPNRIFLSADKSAIPLVCRFSTKTLSKFHKNSGSKVPIHHFSYKQQ